MVKNSKDIFTHRWKKMNGKIIFFIIFGWLLTTIGMNVSFIGSNSFWVLWKQCQWWVKQWRGKNVTVSGRDRDQFADSDENEWNGYFFFGERQRDETSRILMSVRQKMKNDFPQWKFIGSNYLKECQKKLDRLRELQKKSKKVGRGREEMRIRIRDECVAI